MDKKKSEEKNPVSQEMIREMAQKFVKKVKNATSQDELNNIKEEWHDSMDDLMFQRDSQPEL